MQLEYDKFKSAGVSLVSISPQTVEKTKEIKEKHDLEYPVLSDRDNGLAKQIGIAWRFGDDLREAYTKLGLMVGEANGTGRWELPLPATYIIDTTGRVRWLDADVNHTNRPEPSDILNKIGELGLI